MPSALVAVFTPVCPFERHKSMVCRRFKMLYLCMGESPIQYTNVDLAMMPSLLMC